MEGNTRNLSIPLTILLLLLLNVPLLLANGSGYGLTERNSSVVISPDGRYLAVGYRNRIAPVKIIDLETGQILHSLLVESEVSDLDISDDNQYLAAGITLSNEPKEGILRVWDARSGDVVNQIEMPPVFFARFLEDSHTVITHIFNEMVTWSIHEYITRQTDIEENDILHSTFPKGAVLSFNPQNSIVTSATTGPDPSIDVLTAAEYKPIWQYSPPSGEVRSTFFNHQGNLFCVLLNDGPPVLMIWEVNSWKLLHSLPLDDIPLNGCFSTDDRQLAVHFEDDSIQIWISPSFIPLHSFSLTTPEEKLFRAAKNSNHRIIAALLQDGVEADSRLIINGPTALFPAVSSGDVETVQMLLDQGADINLQQAGYSFYFDTVLLQAVANDDMEMVRFLVEAGADVNLPNVGTSPLWQACMNGGNLEIVEYLLVQGADKYRVASYGQSAISAAANSGNLGIVRLLYDRQIDIGDSMRSAASRGHTEIVRFFLDPEREISGVDLESMKQESLVWAIRFNQLEVTELLILTGVDMNPVYQSLRNAVREASRKGYNQVLEYLFNSDLNLEDVRLQAMQHMVAEN